MSTVHPADLQLLRTLHVLIEERSVTRAAARLGVTQSAVSHALARLREQFRDPLLVRTARAMVPTAHAARLAEPLRRILGDADALLRTGPAFDPATSSRRFTLEAIDHAQLLLLPSLLRQLAGEAPGVDLVVKAPADGALAALESGALDLTLGIHRSLPAGYRRRVLFRIRFAVVVRRDHPAVGARLTLDDYLALPHLLIAPRGGTRGMVDDALGRIGQSRRIALVLPSFLSAPLIVAESDLVLTIDERVARAFERFVPLRVLRPPIDLEGYEIAQVWHERSQRDAGHRWLRRALVTAARSEGAQVGPAPRKGG